MHCETEVPKSIRIFSKTWNVCRNQAYLIRSV